MKRRALFILLLLAAGAIVNVAVAWGVSLFVPSKGPRSFEINPQDVQASWERHAPEDWPGTASSFGRMKGEATVYSNHEVDVLWLPAPLNQNWLIYVIRVGWPCMALDGVKLSDGRLLGILEVSDERLPFRPIWPGFAINTVFYAVILWGLFAAPFALRRRRRIKCGLCPKCAYPVGTNAVCTECGAAVRTP